MKSIRNYVLAAFFGAVVFFTSLFGMSYILHLVGKNHWAELPIIVTGGTLLVSGVFIFINSLARVEQVLVEREKKRS